MYRCIKCNRVFSKFCTLFCYVLVYIQFFLYLCGICDLEFRDMRVLLKYLDFYGEDVDCLCLKCEKINQEKIVVNFVKKLKFGKGLKFKCDICGKQCNTEESWKSYVNSYILGIVFVSCNICKMKFFCYRVFNRYRMFSYFLQNCSVCFEFFLDLVVYMVNYLGVFIYKCGLCSDGFNRRFEFYDYFKVYISLGNIKFQNQLRRRVKFLFKKIFEVRFLKKTKLDERKVVKRRGVVKGFGVEK